MSETEIQFPTDLRALLAQRIASKTRRIHKQWFCLDPAVQQDLDAARAEFAEKFAQEAVLQQSQQTPSRKYSAPTSLQLLSAKVDELTEKSRQVGVMGVFQNLTDDQIEAAKKVEGAFGKASFVLDAAFQRWETADGQTIPDDVFGREDLASLMQPEVLEQGEWLPLASKIIGESTSVIDRPTSPAR